MKGQKKGILFGFVLALILMCGVSMVTGSGASASNGNKAVSIAYRDIKICIDGQTITPKDANGNTVEPFILDGTTYLPVRAVGSAFGKEVDYDGKTHTVYIGQKPAGGGADGTRSNPLNASTGATVTFAKWPVSVDPTRQIKFKVLNTITGDGANYLATKTSGINKTPGSGQEWLFFEVEVNYISSSKGEDDQFTPSSLLGENNYFKADGSSLGVGDDASFYDAAFTSYSPSNQMYPGSTSKVMVGLLVNKGYDKVLLKVPNNSDSKNETNTWIHMNAAGSTISTVDAVKSHFNIDQGGSGNHDNDPVKITLKNTLPETLSYYEKANATSADARATITDFSYTVSGTSAKLTFTGEKTYDAQGNGYSRPVYVGWKLYDSEGYVVDDGTARSTSIKVGEKFKNCEDTIYSLEPGEYTLEIMGVRG